MKFQDLEKQKRRVCLTGEQINTIASFKGISGDDLKAYIGAINEVWVNDNKV